MGILLSLTPFILFAVLSRLVPTELGLLAAAVLSLALVLRERLRPGGSIKVLEGGTVLLFGSLALYTWLVGASWTLVGVRLAVDVGLFVIALGSILIRMPFTLQYAREQVPQEFWEHPAFWATNYAITGVWTAAFAVQVLADLVLIYLPAVPAWIAIAAIVGSLAFAIWFTGWYPALQRRRAQERAAAGGSVASS
jgi:hypothetical protein